VLDELGPLGHALLLLERLHLAVDGLGRFPDRSVETLDALLERDHRRHVLVLHFDAPLVERLGQAVEVGAVLLRLGQVLGCDDEALVGFEDPGDVRLERGEVRLDVEAGLHLRR